MAPREPLDGVSIDLLHPQGSTSVVETRENQLGAHTKFHGSVESCDVTIPHGAKIDVRVRFDDDFEHHGMPEVRVIIGIGDHDTLGTWAQAQGWIVSRGAVENKHEFVFSYMNRWAANGDDQGLVPLRAPDLIESHADPYEKRKEERLTWQTDFHAAQGSVIVHVQRGSFVSPAALADHADGLYFRHGIRSTDPPAGYHEDLAQARIDNAHSEEPMEPAIIRWEWFRIPGNALFGMAIAVEFRNRIESGDQDNEDKSDTESPPRKGKARRRSPEASPKPRPAGRRNIDTPFNHRRLVTDGGNDRIHRSEETPTQEQSSRSKRKRRGENKGSDTNGVSHEKMRAASNEPSGDLQEHVETQSEHSVMTENVPVSGARVSMPDAEVSRRTMPRGDVIAPETRHIVEISDDDDGFSSIKQEQELEEAKGKKEEKGKGKGRAKEVSVFEISDDDHDDDDGYEEEVTVKQEPVADTAASVTRKATPLDAAAEAREKRRQRRRKLQLDLDDAEAKSKVTSIKRKMFELDEED